MPGAHVGVSTNWEVEVREQIQKQEKTYGMPPWIKKIK